MRRFFLVFSWLAVGACTNPLAPQGAEPFIPPASFSHNWATVEACSHQLGDLTRIQWFVVPATATWQYNFPCTESSNGACQGVWIAPHHIYVAAHVLADSLAKVTYLLHTDGSLTVDTVPPFRVVKHEMLHDLLQSGDHPAAFTACRVR